MKRKFAIKRKEITNANCDAGMTVRPNDSVNDVDWYSVSENILRDSASFPFSMPVGTSLATKYANGNRDDANALTALPGVYVLPFHPSIGLSEDKSSAANIASMKFYSYLRSKNSGARNYEHPDLFMTLMAGISVVEFIAAGARAYGLLDKYSNYNKYVGKGLVQAAGFDYEEMIRNKADFRAGLNIAISKFNQSVHIPKGYKYLYRAIMRNSYVFSDTTGNKLQFYIFKQLGYFEFNGTKYETGSALIENTEFFDPDVFWTSTVYLNKLNSMIDALMLNEDCALMFGDILKAYGDSEMYKINEITPDFSTPIVYDRTVLNQIHNAVTPSRGSAFRYLVPKASTGKVDMASTATIYQEGNTIKYRPIIWVGSQAQKLRNCYVDVPTDDPTPGDVMEATRLQTLAKQVVDVEFLNTYYNPLGNAQILSTSNIAEAVCGSELLEQCYVYFYQGRLHSQNPDISLFRKVNINNYELVDGAAATNMKFVDRDTVTFLPSILAKSGFSHAPITYMVNSDGSSISVFAIFNSEISNCTDMDVTDLAQLHAAALMGMFDIPVFTVTA